MGHEGIGTIGAVSETNVHERQQSYLDAGRRQLFEVALSADALRSGDLSDDETARFTSRLTSMYLHQ